MEIDLVRDELVDDGLRIKTYALLSPITRTRRGPPRESRNSFVPRALSRQGSKCRILSVLMGSIFDRDRIRFSRFRCVSDEIWIVPWRGATGYFCNKGGLRKMAYPLNTRSRFDAKSRSTEKIKPGQIWKVFVFSQGRLGCSGRRDANNYSSALLSIWRRLNRHQICMRCRRGYR